MKLNKLLFSLYKCLYILRHEYEISYSIAFGINLNEFSIFVAPEFFLCGKCKCLENRGEIYHHLEECFTNCLDENNKIISSKIKVNFIQERVSYALAIMEFSIKIII